MTDSDQDPVTPDKPETLNVESGVSAFDGSPFVIVTWGHQSGQWTPEEARAHAVHVLEAAYAAEHNAALFKVLQEHASPPAVAATLLQMVREYRARNP